MRFVQAFLMLALLTALRTESSQAQQATGTIDRTVLPIAEPPHQSITEQDARRAKAPPRFEVKAPAGAPNVVIVLIDDIGFGHASTFGGPIQTPTLQSLADDGLRYNRFHTTALCRPRARRSSRAGTITSTTPGRSWSWPRLSRATRASVRTAWRLWRRPCV